jgi:hypothetical protein
VKAIRARARVQRWSFRQRHLAHGAWERFRLALAHAERAFVVDEATAGALRAEGCAVDVAGCDLEPPRVIMWISAERAKELPSARELPLRLSADLLASTHLVLVPFTDQP